MRYLLFITSLLMSTLCTAQHQEIQPTTQIEVTGAIKNATVISLAQLDSLQSSDLGTIYITNHKGDLVDTLTEVKGVLLTALLEGVMPDCESARFYSEFYLSVEASDGYTVTFSWNELFNTEIGYHVYLITDANGMHVTAMKNRIAMITTSDFMTGRRYVQAVARIVYHRTK